MTPTQSPNFEAALQRLTDQIADLAVHVVESAHNHDVAFAKLNAGLDKTNQTLDRVAESQARNEQSIDRINADLDRINQTLDRVVETQVEYKQIVAQLVEVTCNQSRIVETLIAHN